MELIIVPDDGLVRAGGRLTAALGLAHEALLLSQSDFQTSAAPPARVGVIFLADDPPAHLEGSQEGTVHGVSWGAKGNHAWISASAVADPQTTLDAMGGALADLQAEAKEALEALGPLPDGKKLRGLHLAGMFLDPKLRVPAQTVAGGQFSFTPERMCWERQYTLGIVSFLAGSFDTWGASLG